MWERERHGLEEEKEKQKERKKESCAVCETKACERERAATRRQKGGI
jgi:hypothetical protein